MCMSKNCGGSSSQNRYSPKPSSSRKVTSSKKTSSGYTSPSSSGFGKPKVKFSLGGSRGR